MWDARLTSSLILWFIYLSYFVIRLSAVDESRAARFGSVTAIVGFIDVPIAAVAIVFWRTHHPEPLVFTGGLTPMMLVTLIVSLAAFTTLYFVLLFTRVALRNDEQKIKKLEEFYI